MRWSNRRRVRAAARACCVVLTLTRDRTVRGIYEGSPDWCTAEEFLEITQKAAARLPYREHSFLLNPRTDSALVGAARGAPVLEILTSNQELEDASLQVRERVDS